MVQPKQEYGKAEHGCFFEFDELVHGAIELFV